MTNTGWLIKVLDFEHYPASVKRVVLGGAVMLLAAAIAIAQNPAPGALPIAQTHVTVPDGFSLRQAIDFGGRIANVTGSPAMYGTLVNLRSGPRVMGETFELRALPGAKNAAVDSLKAFTSGFGGDPFNFAKLDTHKGKLWEFSGMFRRDRQYFDYDLLGNPNVPGGQTIPIGPSSAPTGSFAWPQVTQSPFLFNTVRRMTDANLTLLPLAKFTYRAGYSQNVMEGPGYSPSGYQFAKYDAILAEYERNGTDGFTGSLEWKPVDATRVTFEEQITHYKADSFFSLAPASLIVQEADGTRAALNDYDSLTPYPASACNPNSLGGNPMLSAPQMPGGLPVINAACAVVTNYLRSQPTRFMFPTEVLRLQSSNIRNVVMNGDLRFTMANMNLPSYHDSYQGLNGTTRSLTYTGNAKAKRQIFAADYGLLWQVNPRWSLAEQADYSILHQPGVSAFTSGITLSTPATANNETITYAGALTTKTAAQGASTIGGSPAIGVPLNGYFGQSYFTNDLTASWDATPRTTISLTYRYRTHTIAQGTPHNAVLAVGSTTNGTVSINENGGILSAAVRPASNLEVNGSAEIAYADNAFTPLAPRQLQHYRVHAMYRPKAWATINGAYNDLERHNNTNNNQAAVSAGDDPYEGPLNHVDHSRFVGLGADLAPSEHYGVNLYYSYSDVYAATNVCYNNGASATTPGTASLNASGAPAVCPGVFARGSTTQLTDWLGRDFMDAPTQFGTVAIEFSPVDKIHSNVGYRITSVQGSRFFNDARDVNGSLVSTYQSPFVSLAWTMRRGLVWKGQYNFFGYGEGGPSGPQFCSTSTSTSSAVAPCTSLNYQTGWTITPAGETAPRNFHANNVEMQVHYEF